MSEINQKTLPKVEVKTSEIEILMERLAQLLLVPEIEATKGDQIRGMYDAVDKWLPEDYQLQH